ncbi:MAG: peptide chain release factor N(5)-glutamine methyltransferase [Flavobacteriales bacterium]
MDMDWPRTNDEAAVRAWIRRVLEYQGADSGEWKPVTSWLLDDVTGRSRGERMMASPYRFSESQLNQLSRVLMRLGAGEPIQYVMGQVEFMGLDLAIGPGALIPRPETEELTGMLVEYVAAKSGHVSAFRVLDLCTGSGCIALGLRGQLGRQNLEIQGEDVSEDALHWARLNARKLNLDVNFWQNDLLSWAPKDSEPWDVIVSNPPYIPESEALQLADHVRMHEPKLALFTPVDEPLHFYQAILAQCLSGRLADGGLCAMECHRDYAEDVMQLFADADRFDQVEIRRDLQGENRFVWAQSLRRN